MCLLFIIHNIIWVIKKEYVFFLETKNTMYKIMNQLYFVNIQMSKQLQNQEIFQQNQVRVQSAYIQILRKYLYYQLIKDKFMTLFAKWVLNKSTLKIQKWVTLNVLHFIEQEYSKYKIILFIQSEKDLFQYYNGFKECLTQLNDDQYKDILICDCPIKLSRSFSSEVLVRSVIDFIEESNNRLNIKSITIMNCDKKSVIYLNLIKSLIFLNMNQSNKLKSLSNQLQGKIDKINL
ncbi:unnamed protein product [Paramecium sonneborni]|uniref:Uncharacterized protein n=1 Tax=Paramecium sonneborni TaxID=65129 RepID=A0A8S1NVA6_9CILI|nr:unnamed protein product [Paramecium sonneborni]